MTNNPCVRIGILGLGRLGTLLARALHQAGQEVVVVWSRDFDRAQSVAGSLPRCRARAIAQSAVDRADLLFITTPDDVIEPFACSLEWWRGQSVVHCSGALDRSVLFSAAEVGASTGTFHPLQSITEASTPETLHGITIGIEARGLMKDRLADIARSLGARPMILPQGSKARYHAGATMASNYLVTLASCAVELLEAAGLARDEALAALLPLMRGTLENLSELGLPDALTGPIARGDARTILSHQRALDGLPEIAEIYESLGRQTVALARELGQLQPEQLQRLSLLFDQDRARLGAPLDQDRARFGAPLDQDRARFGAPLDFDGLERSAPCA
jgi:predicted short-subunit dehydrogenase-like oxidoreductase (DUF2520 family)